MNETQLDHELKENYILGTTDEIWIRTVYKVESSK